MANLYLTGSDALTCKESVLYANLAVKIIKSYFGVQLRKMTEGKGIEEEG